MEPIGHQRLFIDGKFVDSSDRYEIRYPYDEHVVGTVARAGETELEAALVSSATAFVKARRLSRAARASALRHISRGIAERRFEIERAIVLCTGKPIDYTRGEVNRAISVFALAAEEIARFGGTYEPLDFDPLCPNTRGIVERFPLGTIAAIGPFNFPLNLLAHKI
ncbi:MAG TPA: aldehyde dehydrogenase family protein, partial [Candidatus Binataceae bacterium]|nr:aldehyde dehydrogenase family protein [Candidatus Binataceae bacterium]